MMVAPCHRPGKRLMTESEDRGGDRKRASFREAAEVRAALQSFLRRSEQLTRANGLTSERYQLLLFVKVAGEDGDGATVGELSRRLELAQSSVTQLVRRAEDLGLLRRELSSRDARVHYLRLTDEGERRLAAAVEALRGERERLISLLSRLQDA
jgi:DNA-binding MarR family transcriptional regulator